MNFFETIGSNILGVLNDKGMKQTELADEVGVSKQVMSKIINGQKAINALEIKQIADVLEVDVSRLMEKCAHDITVDESLVMLMGTVTNQEAKKTLKFLNKVIDELVYVEDLLYE